LVVYILFLSFLFFFSDEYISSMLKILILEFLFHFISSDVSLHKVYMKHDASDPRLEGNNVVEEMELVLKLGLFCSHSIPTARPSMKQVVQFLDVDADMGELLHDSASFRSFKSNESSNFTSFLFFKFLLIPCLPLI
jgi:hypothetical protein